MGLLEKANAARDREGDLAAGQFELKFERVKMRTVKDGDVAKTGALVAEFQGALGDKRGLLRGIHAGDEGRFQAGFPGRRQFFGELAGIMGDNRVGDLQDFRRAPVIGFDFKDFGARVPLGEIEDIGKIGPAPRIDTLRIVAHHRDIVMPGGEQIDQIALELVRILIFVHQDELETALVMFANIREVLQQFEPEREQIVKVHRVARFFAGQVTLMQIGNLLGELIKITELPREQIPDGLMRIRDQRKNFVQDIRFGEIRAFGFNFGIGEAGFDEVFAVIAIKDGKIALIAQRGGVETERAGADSVESAAPERMKFMAEQVADAAHHFRSGFISESEQQNAIGGNLLFQQESDPIGQSAGFARTSPRDHQSRAWGSGDCGILLLIKFAGIINIQPDFRGERFNDIIERHRLH